MNLICSLMYKCILTSAHNVYCVYIQMYLWIVFHMCAFPSKCANKHICTWACECASEAKMIIISFFLLLSMLSPPLPPLQYWINWLKRARMRSSLKRIKELKNRNEEEAKQSSMEDNWKANHHQCSPVNRQKRKRVENIQNHKAWNRWWCRWCLMNGMKRTRMQKDEKRQNVEKKKTVEQNSLMAVAWMPTGPAMKCFASKLQLAGYYTTAPYPTILLVMHTNLNSLTIHLDGFKTEMVQQVSAKSKE